MPVPKQMTSQSGHSEFARHSRQRGWSKRQSLAGRSRGNRK
jgi:hypothetical protein